MSFTSRWVRRRVRNKALFNYPKRITPKYAVKSYTLSSLLLYYSGEDDILNFSFFSLFVVWLAVLCFHSIRL